MFYLIGGAPRNGKTIVAKQLSKELGIPWISTDTLESVVAEYIPEDKFYDFFPKNKLRKETNNSNDEMYSKYTSQEIANSYINQGKSLTQAIGAFIQSESHYDHSYILEGHHLQPSLVAELETKFKIKSIFIGREDVNEINGAISQSQQKNDWVIVKTKDKSTFPKIATMLSEFSTFVRNEAKKYGYEYVSMEGDFNQMVEEVVKKLK
jgi:2-phosphoglycerate kinase